MRLFIHVGFPKCASTSLQILLAEADRQNVQAGLCYPQSFRLRDGYRNHQPIATPGLVPGDIAAELQKEIAEKRCHTALISWEGFSEWLADERIRDILRAIIDRFGAKNVTFLFFVRNVFDYVNSSYAQFIAHGLWTLDKARFFRETDAGIGSFMSIFKEVHGADIYDFAHFVEAFSAKHAGAATQVLSVHEADNGGTSVFEAIFRLLGAEMPTTSVGLHNTRLGRRRIAFARDFQRRFGQARYEAERGKLLRSDLGDADFPSAGLELSKTQIAEIARQLPALREGLLKSSGGSFDEVFQSSWA